MPVTTLRAVTLSQTPSGHMPYFAALDGVRAYCILLVIYNHLKLGRYSTPWVNGHLGVDLFFILSGFLITTLLTREQVFRAQLEFAAFYWRRLFRIAPVYLVVLGLYVVVAHLHGQGEKWVQLRAGLPWFLTMMNEYVREPAGGTVFTHTWSLGVEEKFYVVWPMLAFAIARTLRIRTWLLFSLFGLVAIASLLGHTYLARAYFGLLVGCGMAMALAGPYASRIAAVYARVPATALLGLFLLGFVLEHLSKNLFFLFSLLSALFLTHLVVTTSWLWRAHTWGPLRWMGQRSYGMYLVHVLCLNVVEARTRATSLSRALLLFVAGVALTAAAAEVLYRVVEEPARRWGRAWLARRGEVSRSI